MKYEVPAAGCEITNSVMSYSWGMRNGISKRLDLRPTGQPEAELWIGAHPKAPSVLRLPAGDGLVTLRDVEVASDAPLSFLLKMLAVDDVLSIQAHPSKALARQGFAKESAAGIPISAASRNYRDTNAKPELIVALESGFEALCGFRPVTQTVELLHELASDSAEQLGAQSKQLVLAYADRLQRSGLADTVAWALAAHRAARETLAAVTKAAEHAGGSPLARLICRLIASHPDDPGVLVAILLNQVCLEPGAALWLPPGTPHAYLSGYGIEIMGPSDNVLRGGLTPKHIDTAELLQVLVFNEAEANVLAAQKQAPATRFCPDPAGEYSEPFELVQITSRCNLTTSTLSCALVTDGEFSLTVTTAEGSHHRVVRRGESVVLPAAEYAVAGAGRLFFASGALTACDAAIAAVQGSE